MANVSVREAIALFAVNDKETGALDVAATTVKFTAVLGHYNASQEANDSLIKESLNALFTDFKGAFINSQAVGSMVIQKMIAKDKNLGAPALYPSLHKRVLEVIHQDAGEGKTYVMRKGTGGGWAVQADQPVKPPTPITE